MANSVEFTTIGTYVFNREAHEIIDGSGKTFNLRPQTSLILAILVDHAGNVVTKQHLMDEIWKDTHVTDDSLVQCISEIRKLLGPDGVKLLTTVPKKGYRLKIGSASTIGKELKKLNRQFFMLVLAFIVLVSGVSGWMLSNPSERPQLTIAVLPFVNMSGDAEQNYFSNGVAEDLIVSLSKISDLRVVSRGASFSVSTENVDIRDVAEMLNATYLLEGSIRRVGDQMRVSAALVDGVTGTNLWAERYQGSVDDIFRFQETVLTELVSTLSVRLSKSERSRLGIYGTTSVEAHDAYLRGRELENLFTRETNYRAEEALLESISKDPNFAIAHAHLAQVYSFRAENHWTTEVAETIDAAMEAALTAIELDEDLPFARFSLGRLFTRSFFSDFDKAIVEFKKAIDLDPNYVDAYVFLANTYIFDGRAEEALPLVETAFVRNPIPPYWYYLAEGMAHYFLGNYEEAEIALTTSRDRNLTAPFSYRFLIATYGQLGRNEDSEWTAMEYESLGRTATITAMLDITAIKAPKYRSLFEGGLIKAGIPDF